MARFVTIVLLALRLGRCMMDVYCFSVEEVMSYRIDQKGKVFTVKVTKQTLPVIVRIEDTLIYGNVHLAPESRLKDEMNGAEVFIAITEARVVDAQTDQPRHQADVIVVNKHRIAWIGPDERYAASPGAQTPLEILE